MIVGLAAAALLSPAAALAERPAGEQRPPSVRADRDGDRVFDDLERRVARSDAGRRLSILVRLRAPATRERVARLQRASGGFDVRRRFRIVDAFAATIPAGRVRALAQQRGIVHVESDGRVRAQNQGAQLSFGVAAARQQDPLLDGDADGAPASYSSADLVAAVIDTGIEAGHTDLDGGKVIAFKEGGQSYLLFTGYLPARMRGEMRSYAVAAPAG